MYETEDLPEADQNMDTAEVGHTKFIFFYGTLLTWIILYLCYYYHKLLYDLILQEENEYIDKPNLNVDTAFGKFRGKALIADRVDFSDRLTRNLRTGYDARWVILHRINICTPGDVSQIVDRLDRFNRSPSMSKIYVNI